MAASSVSSEATRQARGRAKTGATGARARRPRRFGSEKPRVFTPPLRPLEPRSPSTESRTLGYQVIDFSEQVLGITLYPWQKWLLVHMLELLPEGGMRFRTVVVLVARQNGKSTLSQVLALWFMAVWGWPLVLGTAQDLETAEEVWQGAVDLAEEDPELASMIKRVVKVNGKKALELADNSGDKEKVTRYKVKAANRKAGRGFTGNLIMLDELREHQNWDAWGAITKTTMAQAEALVFALSNAGDVTSIVLRYLRKMAHEAIGDPDGICAQDEALGQLHAEAVQASDNPDEEDADFDELDDMEQDEETLGLFEWSALPGCSKWDRDQWAIANPSLNWNPGFTERTIAAACKTDPEWVFRTECLCQWSDGVLDGPFPPGTWEKGQNKPVPGPDGLPMQADEDRIVTSVMVGLGQSGDREMVYVAFAGRRADGVDQVEIAAGRRGYDWLADWLMEPRRRKRIVAITGQSKGAPVSPLLDHLEYLSSNPEEDFDIPVVRWEGSDLTAGWAGVDDAVRDTKVRHQPQPVLDIAATTAVLKVFGGGAKLPDQKASPADIASLMAFTAAHWLLHRPLERKPPPPPPPPVAVDSRGEHAAHAPEYDDNPAHWAF
ncbi:terminase [Zhihengliuella halotolerans]|uniref:Phage terminase large subunit-like protein n=1 Tax=Zhihengliuella halotolerans TaxID=370736 RepID=A0A4Q8AC31_9MICC|nr:terminase [Zhihengliuella halotolerans]RZU61750.1 phage terminase large subunit-like protein [Zhihengliuella halotolerans]